MASRHQTCATQRTAHAENYKQLFKNNNKPRTKVVVYFISKTITFLYKILFKNVKNRIKKEKKMRKEQKRSYGLLLDGFSIQSSAYLDLEESSSHGKSNFVYDVE